MRSTLPKIRDDLDLRPQTTADGTVLLIKDPASGEFFRVGETERLIIEQLDGATSPENIQRRLEERFGEALAPETLARFLGSLRRNGLLETDTGPREPRRRRRRRLNGNALYFRFRLFDPDRLFSAMAPQLGWCFTPAFMFLSAGVILTAVVATLLNWGSITGDAARLYSISALPLIAATVFAVISAHEFAHGLTCKHFGGEVREIGFLLLYLQPALYCNVSDAWLFPSKSQRLWVGLAGPYLEILLWAAATLTWCLTDATTWLNYVALIVMVTSGVKTLLNFNPLIKLDGYYLLSDYLEIPNLRKKAFECVGRHAKRALGLASKPAPVYTRREQRIFFIYGLTSLVFSFVLLGYAAFKVGGFLIERDQRVAFLALVGAVGARTRLRMHKLFGRGQHARASKTRRSRPRRTRVALAALAALAALLMLGRAQLRVEGTAGILPLHNADVRALVGGIVDEICVDEGDRVRKGDVIARLSDRDYRAELEKTEAEIEQSRARLDLLIAGPTQAQIEVARTAVMKAEDRLEFARTKLARDRALFEQQLVSRTDFDTTRELESTARNELAQAQSGLEVLLKGTRPEEIEAATADLARLESQGRYLREQLGLVNVLSPASGVVTTPSRQLKEMMRQMVQRGDLIAKVHELDTVTVEVTVPEKEIADVHTGQSVALKVRAYPNRLFHGQVTRIAMTAQSGGGSGSVFPAAAGSGASPLGGGKPSHAVLVVTETDNSEGLLKPGMTGVAKIYCGERRLIDLVTRRVSLTFKVQFWSWW
jgi:multidrug resistance efflux pump